MLDAGQGIPYLPLPVTARDRKAPLHACAHQSANVASIMRRRAGLALKLEDLFESLMTPTIHQEAQIHHLNSPEDTPVGMTAMITWGGWGRAVARLGWR
jgi:hypothetical protein